MHNMFGNDMPSIVQTVVRSVHSSGWARALLPEKPLRIRPNHQNHPNSLLLLRSRFFAPENISKILSKYSPCLHQQNLPWPSISFFPSNPSRIDSFQDRLFLLRIYSNHENFLIFHQCPTFGHAELGAAAYLRVIVHCNAWNRWRDGERAYQTVDHVPAMVFAYRSLLIEWCRSFGQAFALELLIDSGGR